MSTAPNTTIDPALDQVALSTAAHLVTAEPANHAGIAAVSVGNSVLTAGDGNGDWTIADGDASGRKLTCAEQTGITIDNGDTGNSTVVGIAYTDGSTLHFYKALSTSKVYTHGDTASIPETDIWEIGDPADS